MTDITPIPCNRCMNIKAIQQMRHILSMIALDAHVTKETIIAVLNDVNIMLINNYGDMTL